MIDHGYIIRERFITHAHEGNGTGCRCCALVDEGILDRLLAALAALERDRDLQRRTADQALEDAHAIAHERDAAEARAAALEQGHDEDVKTWIANYDAAEVRAETAERKLAEREEWFQHAVESWKAEEEDLIATNDTLADTLERIANMADDGYEQAVRMKAVAKAALEAYRGHPQTEKEHDDAT